jgi:hypothetical protein
VTDDTPDAGAAGGWAETAERMRAISTGLQAFGLDARLHETKGVLDITATAYGQGSKDIQVICDEDGYVTVSYWNEPGATPAQVTSVISLVLAAITGPPSWLLPGKP